jgi:hypothetical protein
MADNERLLKEFRLHHERRNMLLFLHDQVLRKVSFFTSSSRSISNYLKIEMTHDMLWLAR